MPHNETKHSTQFDNPNAEGFHRNKRGEHTMKCRTLQTLGLFISTSLLVGHATVGYCDSNPESAKLAEVIYFSGAHSPDWKSWLKALPITEKHRQQILT